MNTFRPALRHSLLFAAMLAALALTGCSDKASPGASPDADPGAPTTFIGKAVKEATDEARKELATGNIEISRDQQIKAEITPEGDLLINGARIAPSAEQRALLLEYRAHIAGVAAAGIDIGLQGADLAGKAVGEALKGVLTGTTDQIEKKIEAEAQGIEKAALQLCKLLPAMKITQDKLAAAMPEFKPYATMDQADVDDCGKDGNFNVDLPGGSIKADVDFQSNANGGTTAAEAEAAGAEPAK